MTRIPASVFQCDGRKKTPEPGYNQVRRAVSILNKQHNSGNCHQPPDHQEKYGGFYFGTWGKDV